MNKAVIIGAGGHARDVLDAYEARAEAEVLGFVVETAYLRPGASVNGYPVLGDFAWLAAHAGEVEVVCGVGDPALRRRLALAAEAAGARFGRVVHPSAVLTPRLTLSDGVVVLAGVVMTSNVRLGRHAQVNVACSLSHDVALGDYATLAPGVRLAGNVEVGEGANVGAGAIVIERRRIGAWSIVGAGASVIRDVPADSTAVGCPARVIKQRTPGWHQS